MLRQDTPLRVGTLWTHDLRQPLVEVTPLLQVTFRQVGAESAGLLARATGLAEEPAEAEFNRRFSAGRRCYAAWAGDRLAAYGWVSFLEEQLAEYGLRFQLEQCEAYIWDCFTQPGFRQKHLYSALLVFILQELRAEPLCRAWIGADLDNTPSQRGIDRAGFLRVADLLLLREGGQRVMWLEGYPGVPESLVGEARRVLLGGQEVLRN
jgi:hypothetical protein